MIDLFAIAQLLTALSDSVHDIGDQIEQIGAALDQQHTADIDTITLARAIQGEEAGRFGDQRDFLGEWIAHTAYNRWQEDWWKTIDGIPCTFAARVKYDFHGTVLVSEEDVEPWALRIAHRVLLERRAGGPDKAYGARFAMSLDDLRHRGWVEEANKSLVSAVIAPDPQYAFWFTTRYPGASQDEDKHTDHY